MSKARTAGIWSDWEIISQNRVQEFAQLAGQEHLEGLLQDILVPLELEPAPLHLGMDVSWEPIHRCLTGDHTPQLDSQAGTFPLQLCVLGGRQLLGGGYRPEGRLRLVSLLQPDEVAAVSMELGKLSKEWFRSRFFELPDISFYDIDESSFDWAYDSFELLQKFFASAAHENAGVIHVISQS